VWEKIEKDEMGNEKKKKKAHQRNPSTYPKPKIKLLVMTHHPV